MYASAYVFAFELVQDAWKAFIRMDGSFQKEYGLKILW